MRSALRLMVRGVTELRFRPLHTAFTLAVVVLSTFLAGLFLMVLFNLNTELVQHKGRYAFQIYWSRNAEPAQVETQWTQLATLPGLVERETFTPGQALDELSRVLKADVRPEDLESLRRENPLPYTALITFDAPEGDPDSWAKDMLSTLQSMKDVETVRFNALRMDLAGSWLSFSKRLLWPLIGLLGLAVALVVGNTMKLSGLSRKSEIEILRLVGAGRWYIRLPLLTGGAVIGLLGSIAAVALLKAFQLATAELLLGPPFYFTLGFLPWEQVAGLVLVLTLVSAAGCWTAVKD